MANHLEVADLMAENAVLRAALRRVLSFMDEATLYEMQHPADYSPYLDARAVLDDVSAVGASNE